LSIKTFYRPICLSQEAMRFSARVVVRADTFARRIYREVDRTRKAAGTRIE
jgi:hypothetical protein